MAESRQQTILGQRYALGDELGKGGIGVVYVGYDLKDHRSVAVKILRAEHTADKDALARFEQEATIARKISHENVAAVYDFGLDGATHYLVLELLGPTLKDLLDRRKRIQPRTATRIVSQILAGLGAAHRAGIVHRDVKPQNVLFTAESTGESGQADALHVKLVDFGIARIASARSYTVAGRMFGAVHYVSPEQATGKQVGPASDIYSAGILLYQLLTGVVPFDGEDDLSILRRQVEEAPHPPSQLAPGISSRLEAIALRALEKEPERRWSDAETMRAALVTYDQPPSQWPEAGQTRPVEVPSETRALTVSPAVAKNGTTSQVARVPVARPGGVKPAAKALPPERQRRSWAAPLGFLALVLIAVVLGLVLGILALSVTPLAIALPGAAADAAPARTPVAASATGVALSAAEFSGGCLDHTLPSRLVGGTAILGQASSCPRAVAQFDLVARPKGSATLRLTALHSPVAAPEVAVVLNNRQVFRGQLELPSDGAWGVAELAIADGALRAGHNQLEVRNLAADAQPVAGPWLVLSAAELSWR